MKKTIKLMLALAYIILSVLCVPLSFIFISTLWVTSPGSNDWQEDAMFIPVGFIFLILWAVSLVVIIKKILNKKS
ncbi:MAG: hypothetical protein Q4F95_03455 [Oscillospiraceae bacterium]|nr:hypothetical protein [Oscillospiraceae bacterium]